MSDIKQSKKGTVIFKEGETQTLFYKVISGRVGIYRSYGTEYEKLLTERGPGAIFGEMGIIDYKKRSATAVAMEDCELEEFSDQEFETAFSGNPDQMFELLDQMAERIRELTKDNSQIRRDIKDYADAEGVNVEPTLLDRIMKIVKHHQPTNR